MNEFTFEEHNLVCIYNRGTRTGTITALTEMRSYLEPDETELATLTGSVLEKLSSMTDDAFDGLDLFPDFDAEDAAYGK